MSISRKRIGKKKWETLQTSTKVVQIEDPIQQKREIRPISSTRSLFCKNQANSRFWLMHLIEFHSGT
jgi:hypothetical protein